MTTDDDTRTRPSLESRSLCLYLSFPFQDRRCLEWKITLLYLLNLYLFTFWYSIFIYSTFVDFIPLNYQWFVDERWFLNSFGKDTSTVNVTLDLLFTFIGTFLSPLLVMSPFQIILFRRDTLLVFLPVTDIESHFSLINFLNHLLLFRLQFSTSWNKSQLYYIKLNSKFSVQSEETLFA